MKVEIGTIVHEGVSFSALGSVVSDQHIVGYVACENPDSHESCRRYSLTTWHGDRIMSLRRTGTAPCFGGRVECFSGEYEGRVWSGRGRGVGTILTLRRGRAGRRLERKTSASPARRRKSQPTRMIKNGEGTIVGSIVRPVGSRKWVALYAGGKIGEYRHPEEAEAALRAYLAHDEG